jgi:hypothetical protein
VYQRPGAFAAIQTNAFTRMRQVHLIEGAGHRVPQELAAEVNRLLAAFLRQAASA